MNDPFKIWKFLGTALVLLIPGVYFALRPAVAYQRTATRSEPNATFKAPEPVTQSLELGSPLGMLILDVSESMKGWDKNAHRPDPTLANDPKFIQTLASEAFAFFFAHLMLEDGGGNGVDKVRFAVLMYPDLVRTNGKTGCWVLDWAGQGDFLPLFPHADAADIPQSLQTITTELERWMGTVGCDKRLGMDTPHTDAVNTAVAVIQDHRSRFPAAPVYAVFMTDLDEGAFRPQADRLAHVASFTSAVALKDRSQCERLLPEFLAALDLDEHDATPEFSGSGFPLRADGGSVPVVIYGSTLPEITTDVGVKVPIYGRDGIYFTILNGSSCQTKGPGLVKLKAPGGYKVLAFSRGAWTLGVSPSLVDLSGPPAVLSLRFDGDPRRLDPSLTQQCRIRDGQGREIAITDLRFDPAVGAYTGMLPPPNVFEASESMTFSAECLVDLPKGVHPHCTAQFGVIKVLNLEFLHKPDQQRTTEIGKIPFYPAVK